MATEILMVKCPTCGEEIAWVIENQYRPFCSERCKLIDLGSWANEEYTMAATEDEPLSDDIIRH